MKTNLFKKIEKDTSLKIDFRNASVIVFSFNSLIFSNFGFNYLIKKFHRFVKKYMLFWCLYVWSNDEKLDEIIFESVNL
jgi:hypothetical protein